MLTKINPSTKVRFWKLQKHGVLPHFEIVVQDIMWEKMDRTKEKREINNAINIGPSCFNAQEQLTYLDQTNFILSYIILPNIS